MEECIITETFICPHKEISGKKCSECKIVDLHIKAEPKPEYTLDYHNKFNEALKNIGDKSNVRLEAMNILGALNNMEVKN